MPILLRSRLKIPFEYSVISAEGALKKVAGRETSGTDAVRIYSRAAGAQRIFRASSTRRNINALVNQTFHVRLPSPYRSRG
jgi:hypothetical protein